jgi:hypothetical protein
MKRTNRRNQDDEDKSWYGPIERRQDLGDRRGSGSLGSSEIGVFRPDYRAVTPVRWERRRYNRPYYYRPYYYRHVPPVRYVRPAPRYYYRPRSWYNYFW